MKLEAATCLLSLLTVACITNFASAERKPKKSSNRHRSGRREQDEPEVTSSTPPEDPLAKILPLVTFNCKGRHEGYYADVQFDCEVFHYCNGQGMLFTFMCPPTSRFNQKNLICDYDRFGKKSCAKSSEYFHINEGIRPKDNNTITTSTMGSIVSLSTMSPIYESYDSRIAKDKEVTTTTEAPKSWKHGNLRQKVTDVPTNAYVTENPREIDAPQDAPYEYDEYEYPMPRNYYDDYETSTEAYYEDQLESNDKTEKKKKLRKKKKSATIIGTSVHKSTTVVGRSVASGDERMTTEQMDIQRETTTTEAPKDYMREVTTTGKTDLYQETGSESPRRKQVLDYDDPESEAEASEDKAISQSPDEYGSRKERRSENDKGEATPSTRRRGHRRDRKLEKDHDTAADSSTNTPVRSLFNRPRPKNKFHLRASTSTTESSIPPTNSDQSTPSHTSAPQHHEEYSSAEQTSEEIVTEKPKLPRTRTQTRERKPYASRLTQGRPRRKKIRTTTTTPAPDYEYKAEVVEIQPTEPPTPKPRTRTRGRKKLRVNTETTVERPKVYYDDYESTTQSHFTTTTERPQHDYDVTNYNRGTTPPPASLTYYNSQPLTQPQIQEPEEHPSRVVKKIRHRKRPQQTTTLPPPPVSTFVGPLADPFDIPSPTHLFHESTEPPTTSPPRNRATIRLNTKNVYDEYNYNPTTPAPRKKKVLKGHKVTIALSKHLTKPKKKVKVNKEFFFKPKPDPLPDYGVRLEEERRRPAEYENLRESRPHQPTKENHYNQGGYRESRYMEPQQPQYETRPYPPAPQAVPQRPPQLIPVPIQENYQNSNGFSPLIATDRPISGYGEISSWYPVSQSPRPNQAGSNQLEGIYQNAPVFTISENPDGLYAVPQPTTQESPREYYDYQPQQQQYQPSQNQVERPPSNQYQQSGSQYQPSRQPEPYQEVRQHEPYQEVRQPEPYQEVRQPEPYQEVRQPEPYQEVRQPEPYQEIRQPEPYQEVRQPEPYQEVRQPQEFVEIRHQNEYRPQYETRDPQRGNRPREESRYHEASPPRDYEDARKNRIRNYHDSRQEGQRAYENSRQQAAQSQEHFRPAYEYEPRPERYPSQNAQALRNEYPYPESSQNQPVTDQYTEVTSYQTDPQQQQQPQESQYQQESRRPDANDNQRVETSTSYEPEELRDNNQNGNKPVRERVVFITEVPNVQGSNQQPRYETNIAKPNQVEYDSDKQNYQQQGNINEYVEEIAYPLNAQQQQNNQGDHSGNYPVYSDSQEVITTLPSGAHESFQSVHTEHSLHSHHNAPTIQSIYHSKSYPVTTHVNYKHSDHEPDVSDSITSSQYVDKQNPFSNEAKVPSHESDKDGTHFDDREQKPFMGSYSYKGPKVVVEEESNPMKDNMFYKELGAGETFDSISLQSNNFHMHDGLLENSESINRASKKREAIYEAPQHKNFFNTDFDLEEAATADSNNNKTGNTTEDPSQVRRRRQIIFADHIHQAVSPYMGSRPPLNNPFGGGHVMRQGQIFMQDNGRFSGNPNSVINARPIPQDQRFGHLSRHPAVLHGAQPIRLHHPQAQPQFHPHFIQSQRQQGPHLQPRPHGVVVTSPSPGGHILMGFPLTVPTIRVPHPVAPQIGQQIIAPPHANFQAYSRPVQPQGPPPNEGDNRQYQQDRPNVQYSEPYHPNQQNEQQSNQDSNEGRPQPHHYEEQGVAPGQATVPYYGYGYNPYRRPAQNNQNKQYSQNSNQENSNDSGEDDSNDSREREPNQNYDTRERPQEYEDDRRGQSDSYNNNRNPNSDQSYSNHKDHGQSESYTRDHGDSNAYNQDPYQSNSYNQDNDRPNSYDRDRDGQSEPYERDRGQSDNSNSRPNAEYESRDRDEPSSGQYESRDRDEPSPGQYDSQEDTGSNEEKPSQEEGDSGNATEATTLPYPDNVHAHYLKHYNNSDPISNPFDSDFFKPPPYYHSIPPYADLSLPKKETNDTHQMDEKKPNEHGPPFRPPPPPVPPTYYGPYDPSTTQQTKNETVEKRPPFDYNGYTIPPVPDFTVTFPPPSKYTTTTEDPKSVSESIRDSISVTEATGDVTNLPSPVMAKSEIQETSEEPPTTPRSQPSSTVGFGGRIRPVASKIFPRPTYKPSREGGLSTVEPTTTKSPFTYRRASTSTTTIAPYANEDHNPQTPSNRKVFHATGGAMSDKKLRPKLFGAQRNRPATTESDLTGGESELDYVSEEPLAEFLISNQREKDARPKPGQQTSLSKTEPETNEVTTKLPSTGTTNYKHGFELITTTPVPVTTGSTKWSEPVISQIHQYNDQEIGSSPWAIYKEIGSPASKKFSPTWITDKPYKVEDKTTTPDVVTVPSLPVHKLFNVSVKWSPKIDESQTAPSTKTIFKIPPKVAITTTPIPTIETARVTSSHITRYTSQTSGTPWRVKIEDLMPRTKAQNVVDEMRPVYNAKGKISTTTPEPSTFSPFAAYVFEKTTTTEAPITTTATSTTTTSKYDVTTTSPVTTSTSSTNGKKSDRVEPSTTTTTTTENPFPGLDMSQLSLVDNIVADSVVRVVAAHAPPGYLEKFDSKRLHIKAM